MFDFKTIEQWNSERNRLIQLNYQLAEIQKSFEPDIEKVRTGPYPRDFSEVYSQINHETRAIDQEIDRILSDRLLRRALRYGVPIPNPHTTNFWYYAEYEEQRVLNSEGRAHIRREAAREREMLISPFLSVGSLIVSFISIAIAFAALIKSG